MIDWITAHLVTPHTPIPAGRLLSLEATGEIKWDRPQARQIRATHEASVLLSTVSTKHGNALRIDGNPLKFLQGHNLFGSDDYMGLLFGMYVRIAQLHPELELPELQPFPYEYQVDIKRLDITYMFDLGTDYDVQQYIDAIAARSRSRVATGVFSHGTLYWQKNSRRWSRKLYAKGPEFAKRLPQHMEQSTVAQLFLYATGKLRDELTLRALELDRVPEELHAVSPMQLFERYRGRIVTTANLDVPNDVLARLPRPTRAVYYDWRNGHNIKADLPKNTFYRHRRALLSALNIDISAPAPDTAPSNVVNFVRTLEPKLCTEVPPFAVGTELYYDPASQLRQLKLIG